jgi:branched-subunit amino acid aminotransferase/4-amino-4-deoxychorismate lyase
LARAIRALVDGLPVETLPIDDRGLQYGHGVFETCRVVDGRIPLWEFHRERLNATALRLRIPLDLACVEADANQLAAEHTDAVLKILITAGGSDRGYRSDGLSARRVEQRPGIELPMEIRDVAVEEIDVAEECFLTNAVVGVWPVARILDRDRARLRPGRIAHSIIDALEARFGFPRSR